MNECLKLDNDMRACRKCAPFFSQNPVDPRKCASAMVEPRAIVSGLRPRPVMLIGQAPGLTEYETGKPFQGSAGQGIREIFDAIGLQRARFDTLVYSSAVIKCFPGSKRELRSGNVREDVLPSAAMIDNCKPFFESQIRLANPEVIVLLGKTPLSAYLKLTGRRASAARLEEFVGKTEEWNGRTVVFFPHTSGASRWLNSSVNRRLFDQAKAALRAELIERGITTP